MKWLRGSQKRFFTEALIDETVAAVAPLADQIFNTRAAWRGNGSNPKKEE